MRYVMRQKLWAMGNDFCIQNEHGEDAFLVDGKAFSLGHKLSFQNMGGEELAYIEQKLLSFKRTFRIFRDGALWAEVIKELSLFKDSYTVDIPGPNDYQVQGDFWDHEYEFIRGGQAVAYVSKAYFTWADTYGVDIMDGEDDVTILATAIVVDLVNQDQRRRR
ncbi:MAG: hypothetical protein HN742_14010 [Lentisphaerae bacterium]|jgi:uncharacterized protein YxjI|nr:hypothetical protein [Lentisphaerota bacterium]MBT4821237.1 hypothetical protein [Lentisphaerota bacterium]MBT5611473.1 hypothetical protein [Lentisphaerota bacterium]MBT7056335.1 hypothetical protein [Lentisphaerota bacterium]MBT7842989.1 hypothetical protein [Lentisphaerota bacterium]